MFSWACSLNAKSFSFRRPDLFEYRFCSPHDSSFVAAFVYFIQTYDFKTKH